MICDIREDVIEQKNEKNKEKQRNDNAIKELNQIFEKENKKTGY